MKLFVVIPAYNEADNIQKTVMSIPRKIFGINEVSVLVIDDGSTDKTSELALNAGADNVISHKSNLGVGAAFMTGIRNAISMGADVVVTLDADSQFNSTKIPELIVPILNRECDVVVGSRFLNKTPKGIPKIKKFGNKIFTKIVSWVIGQKLTDTQSGFRAYSREAILNISVVSDFTYTQEVLIDLKFKKMKILEVPVEVTYDEKRKSRVVKSIFGYSYKALSIIIKSLVFHKPILAFGIFGLILIVGGIVAKLITYSYVFGWGVSPGLSTGLIILGIVSFMMGLFASVVFKRQTFTEQDIRHYIEKLSKEKLDL